MNSALYLLVMFRMPNHVYYAQFTELDAGNLQRTVLNVLLYTASELVSLIVVYYGLKCELRLSAPHQLGFVLSRQAVPVQLSLILWVTYSTQSSLDHFGAFPSRTSCSNLVGGITDTSSCIFRRRLLVLLQVAWISCVRQFLALMIAVALSVSASTTSCK